MHLGQCLSRSVNSVGLCPKIPILKTPRIVCGYEYGMEYKGLMRVCLSYIEVSSSSDTCDIVDNWNVGQ